MKADSVPVWVLHYQYAEQYGCHAQDVPQTVTLRAWHRWLLWQKTKASHDLWQNYNAKSRETKEQRDTRLWAMYPDKY